MSEAPYFPEIGDERSNYKSPIIPILTELRRKHVVTAAAATSGPQMSLNDASEPLEDGENIFSNTCHCHSQQRKNASRRRRSSVFDRRDLPNSPGRPSSADLCAVCGKRKIFDPIGQVIAGVSRPRLLTLEQGALRIAHGSAVPEHAEALLQATPHMRHLTPASTDMQGAGHLNNPRGFLGIILPDRSHVDDKNITLSVDYRTSLAREKANQQAASELASFLWILAHEMSLDNYGAVENEVFTRIFSLVHSNTDAASRMAGVAALNALIEAPSADEEKKAIKFANNLSSSLRSPNGDFEFLSAVSKALGHMAERTTNVDFVESEITRALEWLRSDRSQRR